VINSNFGPVSHRYRDMASFPLKMHIFSIPFIQTQIWKWSSNTIDRIYPLQTDGRKDGRQLVPIARPLLKYAYGRLTIAETQNELHSTRVKRWIITIITGKRLWICNSAYLRQVGLIFATVPVIKTRLWYWFSTDDAI